MRKIALITGANCGIGLEVARQLSQEGFLTVIAARSRVAGENATKSLQRNGADVRFIELDLADLGSVQNAAQTLAQQVDHLDVLANNAAILGDENLSVLETGAALLQNILTTNTIGPLLVTQAFLPLLSKSGAGRIINVSSSAGSLNDMTSYAPAYSISKAALNAVTRQLAAALQSKGIAVNSVCPGWVRIDMGGRHAPRSVAKGAETIVWLATAAPQNLTGQFLRDRKVIPW